MVSYLFSIALSEHEQCPIGLVALFSCIYSTKSPTCLSHASVSSVMCPEEFGRASTDGDASAFFNALIAANSSL